MVFICHWSFWGKNAEFLNDNHEPNTYEYYSFESPISPVHFKSIIFWKVKKYTTKWALFALLCLGSYGDILGQNHKILLKNHWKLGKVYNYFIMISILNPKESFTINVTGYHYMSKKRFVYCFDHFEAKWADFSKIMWSYEKLRFVGFLHAQAIYQNAISK
jgi:hypothetical protein